MPRGLALGMRLSNCLIRFLGYASGSKYPELLKPQRDESLLLPASALKVGNKLRRVVG